MPPLLCTELKTPPARRSLLAARPFPQFSPFACFTPLFFSVASAISFGIAAQKMRKNPATSTCEKAAENLWISLEKGVQNAVDFLRVSGGFTADKRLRSGGCIVDLSS